MCGRFTELANPNQWGFPFANWKPRFNIAPTMPVLAIRNRPTSSGFQREICELRWGLIPSWAKDHKIGYRTLNARSETISEKPSFRTAFKSRRCIILASGYYEWKKTGPAKQTYYFRMRDERPFGFLGLWESWPGPPDHPFDDALESCTIITTPANKMTSPIHNRMPCLSDIDDQKLDAWLDPEFTDAAHLASLMNPYSADDMVVVPVGSYVNRVGNEGHQCIDEE